MKLYELEQTHFYVGNCVNSFDDDMEYIAGSGLYQIECLAAIDEEIADGEHPNLISTDLKFLGGHVPTIEKDSFLHKHNNMYILYNPIEDVHYFYE